MFLFFLLLLYKVCHKCHTVFQDNDTKHHCRACGEGFCDGCSSKAAPVPERGWGLAPVRVCDVCYEQRASYAGTHTLNDVKCFFVCVMQPFNIRVSTGFSRYFSSCLCRNAWGRARGGRRWNPGQEGWRSSDQHYRCCGHCYWHPTWWVLSKTTPKEHPYVTGINDPVNVRRCIQCPLVADVWYADSQ